MHIYIYISWISMGGLLILLLTSPGGSAVSSRCRCMSHAPSGSLWGWRVAWNMFFNQTTASQNYKKWAPGLRFVVDVSGGLMPRPKLRGKGYNPSAKALWRTLFFLVVFRTSKQRKSWFPFKAAFEHWGTTTTAKSHDSPCVVTLCGSSPSCFPPSMPSWG